MEKTAKKSINLSKILADLWSAVKGFLPKLWSGIKTTVKRMVIETAQQKLMCSISCSTDGRSLLIIAGTLALDTSETTPNSIDKRREQYEGCM